MIYPVNKTHPHHNHKATNNKQPKAYKATRLQRHKHTKCNYLQSQKLTAYNSKQPTTNIQPTFRSQQPPSNHYEQETCKASCVLLAADQLAQCAFGWCESPSQQCERSYAPFPVHQSTVPHKSSKQTCSSHQPAT